MTRHEQLQKALDGMGNTHTVEDILGAIDKGEMQSFAMHDTWVVTQIQTYPRAKVLEVFLYVGDLTDFEPLREQIIDFAKAADCNMVRAFGRHGWVPKANQSGWHDGARIFWRTV